MTSRLGLTDSHFQMSKRPCIELCARVAILPAYFSSPWKNKSANRLVLPAPSDFAATTSGRTFCCAEWACLSGAQGKFPFPAGGYKPSAPRKAFPCTLSKDHFELTELENKWLIQLFVSHLVHVIYFDSFWHVHYPFIWICSGTRAPKTGVFPGSKK